MELIELTLRNYKCHSNLKLKFGKGVTGIVGDNGSGKSSIISGIRFLFTGEVDTEAKSSSIKNGETEGWVSGKFRLHGKEGYLERHLNSSKVVLKYDGVSYNKATEVKDLWATLLQVDSSIFNNVIIAGQGEIPMLFSGDSTIREKVFQKIFLVPPTDKIRKVIWDNYIKTCPPERVEEDVTLLQTKQVEVAKERNRLLKLIEETDKQLINEAFQTAILAKIMHLEKCKKDQEIRPGFEQQSVLLSEVINSIKDKLVSIKEDLTSLDIIAIKREYQTLLTKKQLSEHKAQVEHDLYMLESKAPTEEEVKKVDDELLELTNEEITLQKEVARLNAELKHLQSHLDKLSNLQGEANCPTCGATIQDITNSLKALEEQAEELKKVLVTTNASYVVLTKKLQKTRASKSLLDGLSQRVNSLKTQLMRYSDVTFDLEELTILQEVIQKYTQLETEYNRLHQQLTKKEGELAVLQEKLTNLAVYDGKSTIDLELKELQQIIDENKIKLSLVHTNKVLEARLEHELGLIEDRISVSMENHKFNAKRHAYLKTLTEAYDALHVSEFPRKLVQAYAEQVEVHLSNYLDKFNIPFRAKIYEGFKIQAIDDENRNLPTVSGGQEMMIGICLRLALHKMFAQAFPLWIIDEGTTHLSSSKKTAYFELIDEIREKKIIDQVIIIDHDERLSDVVDRVIEL